MTTQVIKSLLLSSLLLIFVKSASPVMLPGLQSDKKTRVFILAGQSNMEGRADGTKLNSRDLERLTKAQKNVQLAFNHEPICPLTPVKPSKEIAEIYHRDLIFGPELFFGIALSEAWPDEKILLVKLTEGGSSLFGCWHPEWSEEKAAMMGEKDEPRLYEKLINYVDQTLVVYDKDEYEICAMLWVQGETDTGNNVAAAAYGRNLQQLVRHLRTDLKNDTIPFLLFQIDYEKVFEGMKRTAALLPSVTLIPQSPDSTSSDFYPRMKNGHYNYNGIKKLGHQFAHTYLNIISGKVDSSIITHQ